MGCGWTQHRTSMTIQKITFWRRSRGRFAKPPANARPLWSLKMSRSKYIWSNPPDKGGYGMDGLWNDDFHHTAMVALTGRNEAYYTDYLGTAQEFVSAAKYGYLYQGQWYKWQKQRRGRLIAASPQRARSSPSLKITTRWPTPREACGCIS